ncbi:Alpha-glucoside transport ATP-binding protein AglK [Nymphon striatum]|nr:Alpha-glucoside transport ATP-binding protein AglK [Nymphon striatum]
MVWEASNANGGFSSADKPWLPVSHEHTQMSVAVQEDTPDALIHHYRNAIALRRDNPALAVGDHDGVKATGDIVHFSRTHNGEIVFCAFNLGDEAASLACPTGDWTAIGHSVGGIDVPMGDTLELGPWQAFIATRTRPDLKLTDVAKTYGGSVDVLKNIDLDIKTGELIVFVGPSGCGKSTLLRMIAGLEKITGGELQIDGQIVNDVPPAQRGIAMVFQSYALYPHMTVRDNMSFAMKLAKKPAAEIKAAVDRAAKILQLDEYLDRLPKALSGGQRQRVAIGRSIVRDPKVYLFDEPLSNLDAALPPVLKLRSSRNPCPTVR